jgi:hypothetical protein
MKLRAEDLKRIHQTSRQEPSFKNGECPSDELLIKSFSAEASEEEKLATIDHVTGCASCHWKFEAIRQILSGTGKIAKELEGLSLSEKEVSQLQEVARNKIQGLEKQRREKKNLGLKTIFSSFLASRALKYVSAAAGLLIVFLAAFLFLKTPPSLKRDIARGTSDQALELIAPRGEVKSFPLFFKWRPYPKAQEYEVKLLDEELTDIWKSDRIKAIEVELPQGQFERMEKEKTYYWKVVVHLKAGTAKESGLQEFKLR